MGVTGCAELQENPVKMGCGGKKRETCKYKQVRSRFEQSYLYCVTIQKRVQVIPLPCHVKKSGIDYAFG